MQMTHGLANANLLSSQFSPSCLERLPGYLVTALPLLRNSTIKMDSYHSPAGQQGLALVLGTLGVRASFPAEVPPPGGTC